MNTRSAALTIHDRALHVSLRFSRTLRAALVVGPLTLALALWLVSLPRIDLARMSGFGLLPALPWTFYVALGVLTVGFTLGLRSTPLPERALGFHVVALILVIHGTPAIAYGTLRYAWAWKHVGIVDYIQRHGSVDPTIGFLTAYHNWPGFFALSALYTELAGLGSALSFASWGPVFFNLLFFGVLLVLFGALTSDRRRVWLGVWLFFTANWIGQDYFSPQAFAYFLFLVVVTICVAWFRLPRVPTFEAVRRVVRSERIAVRFLGLLHRSDPEAQWHEDAGRGERVALILLIVILITTLASSHQLTPLMLVLALSALVLFQRTSLRSLPILVAVISVGWVALFAVGFLRGNLYWIVNSLGTVTENANSTLVNLASASHDQQIIARVDRALTVGVWALGGLGFLRLARRGGPDLSSSVLGVAAFGALAFTSYGGEILFRVYFFSLPFFVLLAAAIVYPGRSAGCGWAATAAGLALSAALVGGLLVGYYGKELQNYFSKDEVQAAELLYGHARPGSLLVAGVNDYPWAFSHYEEYSYLALAELLPRDRRKAIAQPAVAISSIAKRERVPCAYVIITTSQRATVDMTGLMPAGSLDLVERRLSTAPAFRIVLRNRSAVVFGTAVRDTSAQCRLP